VDPKLSPRGGSSEDISEDIEKSWFPTDMEDSPTMMEEAR
jgi:hypothetical protein